jgi:hypothetical protein
VLHQVIAYRSGNPATLFQQAGHPLNGISLPEFAPVKQRGESRPRLTFMLGYGVTGCIFYLSCLTVVAGGCMEILDNESNLAAYLGEQSGKRITIVSAFASSPESLVNSLL